MALPEILEQAKEELKAKADDFGMVTPAAIADALRAASERDSQGGYGFNLALTYVAAGMENSGVPNAHALLDKDYKTPLPLKEAYQYLDHASETWRIGKK
jgi:hypothetical protein